ncbi:hypothetical protein GOP47_0000566 [Adiantum capillus-veneris]|uniref:CRAL-TRIO domain-containing protein n=1 Tax=Adiantum capillus-veneris TaxID=13818 RepID=A0A9D4ZT08_ADICA|nr:hypothetical protein GOP47_0000566 [Adiantum capillus-veneris]
MTSSSFFVKIAKRFSSARKGDATPAQHTSTKQAHHSEEEVVSISDGTLRLARSVPSELDFETIPISDDGPCFHSHLCSEGLEEGWKCTAAENSSNSLHSRSASLKDLACICGQDAQGRPIVVVDATKIPKCSCLRSQALQYILKKLDPIAAAGDYDLIFVMSPNIPAWWCLRVYKKLPSSYRKNLRRLLFIHPTVHIKFVCTMLRPFISKKAHYKVHKVKHLADLEKASGGDISLDVLHLGNHVFKYDQTVATRG